jgi:hypothetical protein
VDLPAGTYTIKVGTYVNTNCCILDIIIDGASVGTLDVYSAASTAGILSKAGVVIVGSGAHTIKLLVNGKNASSSGYYLVVSFLQFLRTA